MRQEAGSVPSDAYPSHPPTEAPLRGGAAAPWGLPSPDVHSQRVEVQPQTCFAYTGLSP